MLLPKYLEKHALSVWTPLLKDFSQYSAGWGRKNSFFKAKRFAAQNNLPLLCLEDGFVRSLGLGKQGFAPLSIVKDQTGIYFDATQASDLENLILEPENSAHNERAQRAVAKILKYGITKYNQNFLEFVQPKVSENRRNILVVDQTFGDQSIQYAGASEQTFNQMLAQACQDHPHAQIWIKTHPDVLAGKAKAHFDLKQVQHPNVQFITQNYNPIRLLQRMDEVYVVSSQLGFEALLCNKTVHCFGMPWYAGWGLTLDQHAPSHLVKQRRSMQRSVLHLFYCAYFQYAQYLSPVTQQACQLEEILDLLTTNIEFQKRLPEQIYAYGFSLRKRRFLSQYFNFSKLDLVNAWTKRGKQDKYFLAWGKKAHALKAQGYSQVLTSEDGFVRSVGLGAQLVRPNSLVFDEVGIYYDATAPSRIEQLLATTELTLDQQQRAHQLQRALIDLNISKYNVGKRTKLSRPEHSRVLLVVGQVEDDLSVQLGSEHIKTNLALLKQVREQHPNSYIIYKPHPDVQAGLRIGQISESLMYQYANQVEYDASILECFEICDEVHTMTSLSGFEALIRGLKVYCYGMPFYAGWGLTHDLYSCSRRYKTVSLDTLIYVTLVDYAVYNLAHTSEFKVPLVRPEDVITHIKKQIDQVKASNSKWHMPLLKYIYKFFKELG